MPRYTFTTQVAAPIDVVFDLWTNLDSLDRAHDPGPEGLKDAEYDARVLQAHGYTGDTVPDVERPTVTYRRDPG